MEKTELIFWVVYLGTILTLTLVGLILEATMFDKKKTKS